MRKKFPGFMYEQLNIMLFIEMRKDSRGGNKGIRRSALEVLI
jgi:hypothetical protein